LKFLENSEWKGRKGFKGKRTIGGGEEWKRKKGKGTSLRKDKSSRDLLKKIN